MNWLYYLLEANLYLAVFYAFYRLFLHQETFYSVNRYYLIISTFISFALPFLQVGYINRYFPVAPAVPETLTILPVTATDLQSSPIPEAAVTTIELSTIYFTVYLLIAAAFLLKMIVSLVHIITIFRNATKSKAGQVIYVELEGTQTAFSFFNILFINPGLSRKDTVMQHEMVHIRQNHTVDVLFFELVQIVCWFNPVTYFIKEDIKLVHEYIADELTTEVNIQKHDYALFIIENSFGVIPNPLSNQIFNHSLIKRRIKMLNKQKSGGLAKLRFLLLLPLTSGLLLTSTMAFSKDYLLVDLLPAPASTVENTVQNPYTYSASEDVKDRSNIFVLRIAFKGTGADEVMTTIDKRAIYLNGKLITARNFWGIGDYSSKKVLSPVAASKKYGAIAKNGALEFSGSQIKLVNSKIYSPQAPPPPPVVKFALPKEPATPPAPPKVVKFPLPKKPVTPPPPPIRKKGQTTTDVDLTSGQQDKSIKWKAKPQTEIEITKVPFNTTTDDSYTLTSRPTVTTSINGSGYKDVTYHTTGTKTTNLPNGNKYVTMTKVENTVEGTNFFSGNRIQGNKNTTSDLHTLTKKEINSNVSKVIPELEIILTAPAPSKIK